MTPRDPIQSIVTRAIDLNRYSNKVSNDILALQNRVWVDALNQLQNLAPDQQDTYNAQRLRGILKQTRETIQSAGAAGEAILVEQMQGLAESETNFIEKQLQLAIQGGTIDGRTIGKTLSATEIPALVVINTVEVPPNFARILVSQSPSDIPLVLQRDKAKTMAQEAIDAPVTLNLRTPLGTELAATLDGVPIIKKFRALTESSADLFDSQIIMGLSQGQTISQIQKRLVGNISYVGDRTFLQKGAMLEAKSSQVRALVRTSVTSINNAASQSVYQANQHVTKKYKFVSTLDSRSCVACASKDQQTFKYGDGPTPAIHWNCRCNTVPIVDYEGLGISPPTDSTRASADGQVPASLDYESWLKKQPKGEVEKILGKGKADLFLANKIRIADIVRTDTSEVTLAQLQKSVESGQIEKDRAEEERRKKAADVRDQMRRDRLERAAKEITHTSLIESGKSFIKDELIELEQYSALQDELEQSRLLMLEKRNALVKPKIFTDEKVIEYEINRLAVIEANNKFRRLKEEYENIAFPVMDKIRKKLMGDFTAESAKALVSSIDYDAKAGKVYGKAKAQSAMLEFFQLTKGKGGSSLKSVTKTESRAYANSISGQINIGKKEQENIMKRTLFHEMGHHVEYEDLRIANAAKSWIESRATGKPKSLKSLTGAKYRKDEIAYPDKFIDPYVGKIYERNVTEVVSVGMEEFADLSGMATLYRRDPEHFNFIIGVMNVQD